MERQTITAKEAAEIIGISIDTIYTLTRRREIPHIRAGRRILFRRDSLDEWMNNQEKKYLKDDIIYKNLRGMIR